MSANTVLFVEINSDETVIKSNTFPLCFISLHCQFADRVKLCVPKRAREGKLTRRKKNFLSDTVPSGRSAIDEVNSRNDALTKKWRACFFSPCVSCSIVQNLTTICFII